jgi:hypothetical protein
MNRHVAIENLYRWTFTLVDEMPGPSTGDAAEYTESLGFDPWLLSDLEIVSESDHDGVVTLEFMVTGSEAALDGLRKAHAKSTWAALTPLQPLPVVETGD